MFPVKIIKTSLVLFLGVLFTSITCVGQNKEVYIGVSGNTNLRDNYSLSLVTQIPLTPNYFIVSKICDYTLLTTDKFNQQKNNVAYYYPFSSVINSIIDRSIDVKIPEAIDVIKFIIPYPLLCSEHHFLVHKNIIKNRSVFLNYYIKTNLDAYTKQPLKWDRYSFGNGLSCVVNKTDKKIKTTFMLQAGPCMAIDVHSSKNWVNVYGLNINMKFLLGLNN